MEWRRNSTLGEKFTKSFGQNFSVNGELTYIFFKYKQNKQLFQNNENFIPWRITLYCISPVHRLKLVINLGSRHSVFGLLTALLLIPSITNTHEAANEPQNYRL